MTPIYGATDASEKTRKETAMFTATIDERFLIEHIDRAIEAAKERIEDPEARLQITLPLFTVRAYLVASSDLKDIDRAWKEQGK
jgi:hypothetical protein